jgi:hypothetical protein
MAYYDRLLRTLMELIRGTVGIMKVDGLSEAIENLQKALLVIEDAWATVSLEWTSALAARNNQMETEGDTGAHDDPTKLPSPERRQEDCVPGADR